MTDRKTKRAIVKGARKLVRKSFPTMRGETGSCLWSTWAVTTVARMHGIRLLLMAGSAYWQRIPFDDGSMSTHFGYEWEADSPFTIARLQAGLLPEVHVWASDPKTGDLIDLTTGEWPAQCRDAGMEWTAPNPPDYFWGPVSKLPAGTQYKAFQSAADTMTEILRQVSGGRTFR